MFDGHRSVGESRIIFHHILKNLLFLVIVDGLIPIFWKSLHPRTHTKVLTSFRGFLPVEEEVLFLLRREEVLSCRNYPCVGVSGCACEFVLLSAGNPHMVVG